MFCLESWKQSLLTSSERFRRHITEDPICPMCLDEVETIFHLVRDCPKVKDVWDSLLSDNAHSFYVGKDVCN